MVAAARAGALRGGGGSTVPVRDPRLRRALAAGSGGRRLARARVSALTPPRTTPRAKHPPRAQNGPCTQEGRLDSPTTSPDRRFTDQPSAHATVIGPGTL